MIVVPEPLEGNGTEGCRTTSEQADEMCTCTASGCPQADSKSAIDTEMKAVHARIVGVDFT
jgi:hypothetical protein